MQMQEINILSFWNRFDSVRTVSIDKVAENTGLNAGTLRNLRMNKKLPNLVDTVVIADYLKCSLDWLVLGRVSAEKEEEVGLILKAYLDSDEVTKLLVKRTLRLA